MVVLVLPALGIVVTFGRLGQRVGRGLWRRTDGRPAGRAALVLAAATAAASIAYIWWPNGDYRPIQKGEKGTLQGAAGQLSAIPAGRPALTARRARELGGAPFEGSPPGARGNNTHDTTPTEQQEPSSTDTQTTDTTQTDTTQTTTSSASTSTSAATDTTATATTPTDTSTSGTVTGP
jgi:hypothetical protein